MEIIANTIHDNSVSGVVSSSGSGANIDLVAEDVDELSLALIAPLGSKHNGSHAGWLGVFVVCRTVLAIQKDSGTVVGFLAEDRMAAVHDAGDVVCFPVL